MNILNFFTSALVSISLLLSSTVTVYAQTANACVEIAQRASVVASESNLKTALTFEDETAFDLQVRREADGFYLRVTGDNILLSEETASSLVADPAFAKTGLKSIVIDGRNITLASPLSFLDANIRIIGENVLITGDAQINLFSSAPGPTRSLSIVADRLDFSDSRRRPLNLHYGVSPGASVAMYIKQAFFNGSEINTEDSFWRRFVGSVEMDDPPSEVEILLGSAAEDEVMRVFSEEMEWPLYFAAKLKQTFTLAPFNTASNEKILELIDQYRPVVEAWGEPYPLLTIEVIASAIENNVDFLGRNSAFTPKQDAWNQISSIKSLSESDSFDRLIRIIVATASKKDEAEEAVVALRNEVAEAREEQNQIRGRIDSAVLRLNVLASENQALDVLIAQRVETLAEMSRREFERLKDAQSVKQWTTIAAAVVVVAASFGAATPAVAGAAAAGLSLTGDQIYRHNIGEPFKIADLLESGTKTYAAISGFQTSWGKFLEAKDLATDVVYDGKTVYENDPPKEGEEPISKFAATKVFVASLVDLVKKADGLSSGQPPGPTPLSLTERQNEDEVMKEYLTSRAEFNGEINSLAAQLQSDSRLIEGLEARVADLQIKINELLEIDPVNDQQNARWNANAYVLWALEVRDIAEKIDLLKKSVLFETGRSLSGPSDVLDYPNELLTRIDAGIFDLTAGAGTDYSAALRANLELERDKFLASVDAVLRSASRELQDYLDARSEADTYRRTFTLSAVSRDPVERAFIETLNGQIAQQIVAGTAVDKVEPAFIPIDLTILPSQVPERLIDAKIVAAKFSTPDSSIGDNAISFSIVHPGYGEMRRRDTCAIGDFRSRPDDWRFFTTFFEQIDGDWASEAPRQIELTNETRGRYYAFLPAQTKYHMVVGVHSKNWRRLPRITELSIGLEIME